ncbi:CBO0543 family protein [Bacillus coahuilensis]|uniref:CBO0543 family protein n=1 Tax=Bacillus coahuilensis TaxID=408580 RepID=UPI0001850FC7|nr:CBO0543 family protein [Bacillus coahuilensis]
MITNELVPLLQLVNLIAFEEIVQLKREYMDSFISYWWEHNFLTPEWWVLVILSVLSPIVWWVLVNKKNIIVITLFGLFYGMAAIILDSIGSNAIIWSYPVQVSPYLFPQLYPYDVGIVLIPFMLVYQRYGENFKKFLFASLALSFFLAFVAEPIMEFFHIYKEITWKNIYSFPIYFLLAVICWWIVHEFKKIEQK